MCLTSIHGCFFASHPRIVVFAPRVCTELTQQLSDAAAKGITPSAAVLSEIVQDLNGSYQAMFLQYQLVSSQAKQNDEQVIAVIQKQVDDSGMQPFASTYLSPTQTEVFSFFVFQLAPLCHILQDYVISPVTHTDAHLSHPPRIAPPAVSESAKIAERSAQLQRALERDQQDRKAMADEIQRLRIQNQRMQFVPWPFCSL